MVRKAITGLRLAKLVSSCRCAALFQHGDFMAVVLSMYAVVTPMIPAPTDGRIFSGLMAKLGSQRFVGKRQQLLFL